MKDGELPGYVEERQFCSAQLSQSQISEIVFEMFSFAAKR
jgi:hypothetical protein